MSTSNPVGYILFSVLMNIYMNAAIFWKKWQTRGIWNASLTRNLQHVRELGGSGHYSDQKWSFLTHDFYQEVVRRSTNYREICEH
jgi:hypothetical protein